MKRTRKTPGSREIPRCDAKLKRLADPLKDDVLARCRAPGVTQGSVLKWLDAECGVKSSPAALSEFVVWWPARKRAMAREAAVVAWMDSHREQHPEVSDAELFRLGQRKFALAAMAEDDSKTWSITATASAQHAQVDLERRKAEQRDQLIALKSREVAAKEEALKLKTCECFLSWSKDQRARDIAESTGTSHGAKIQALMQLMFPDQAQPGPNTGTSAGPSAS